MQYKDNCPNCNDETSCTYAGPEGYEFVWEVYCERCQHTFLMPTNGDC